MYDLSANLPVVLAVPIFLSVIFLLVRRPRRISATRHISYVLVDGSNVLYWRNDTPDLMPVRNVVDQLRKAGSIPIVWFDANAGYLLAGRYRGARAFARSLGLPEGQVHVAPKGTPADPLLLEAAGKLRARIVTNDRYRDWQETYPILADRTLLIRGRWNTGRVILEGGGDRAQAAAA